MFVYRVCKMNYGSWQGEEITYGETIKTFDNEQKAIEWCQAMGLNIAFGIETLEVN